MTTIPLPAPAVRASDDYGHARMPRGTTAPEPARIDRVEYGRFRNVYVYISEACQLRCQHCYMGERLNSARKMTLPQIEQTLTAWWRMGGSKVTILGGEPTLHPGYTDAVRLAGRTGYEHVITTTNAQAPALRKFRQLDPADFAYVQVSLDGGTPTSHDSIRGSGTFGQALATTAELTARDFDTRSSAPSTRPTSTTRSGCSASPTTWTCRWSSTTSSPPSASATATWNWP
ncbi:MAG: radical SAM protein [Trebonia sp.]